MTRAEAREHAYLMGLQHRRTGEGEERTWKPVKPSEFYFFSNDAGSRRYRISSELEQGMLAAFRTAIDD